MAAGVNRVETYLEFHAPAEQIHYRAQVSFNLFRAVHDQFAGTSQHAERGDQSRQAEAVVTMQVRDEDMGETSETDDASDASALGFLPRSQSS